MRALQTIRVATTLNSLLLKALIFHLIIVKLVNTNFIQTLPKLLRKHAVMDLVSAMGECHTSWAQINPTTRAIRVMCNILHPASDPLCEASDSRARMTYPELALWFLLPAVCPTSLSEVFIRATKVAQLLGRQLLRQHGLHTSNINRKAGTGFGSLSYTQL